MTLDNIGSILHQDGAAENIWRASVSSLPVTLTFDFNSPQQIDYVGLWHGLSAGSVVNNFNLRFFDGANGTGSEIGSVFSDVLEDGSSGLGNVPLNGIVFDVGSRTGISSITMEITSVALLTDVHVHLGEFMVANNTAAIPEPSSLALLTTGAIGLIAYRRRKRKQAA